MLKMYIFRKRSFSSIISCTIALLLINITANAISSYTFVTMQYPLAKVSPNRSINATPTPIMPFPNTIHTAVNLLRSKDRFFDHGNAKLFEIALTFDDGPNPPYTSQILNILRRFHINATFFDIGRQVVVFPNLVQMESINGNFVENHTWAHPNLPDLSVPSVQWQISTTSSAIERITGIRPTLLRPPYGAFNLTTLAVINTFGLTTITWNIDPQDWSRPGTTTIVNRVLTNVSNGAIILMHDGGGDRSETVAALPTIIETLLNKGYKFVTIQQMIHNFHR